MDPIALYKTELFYAVHVPIYLNKARQCLDTLPSQAKPSPWERVMGESNVAGLVNATPNQLGSWDQTFWVCSDMRVDL